MGLLKGIIYGYLWNSSIFAGYALFYCPMIFILFVSNRLYRQLSDLFITFWQFYVTALLKIICCCEVQVTGDAIRTDEMSILISNHRTRVDWNFLWPTLYHAVEGKNRVFHSTKFILKDGIRHVPGPGWVMQLGFYLFIRRNWDTDQKNIKKYIDYVAEFAYKHILVLFPEGTDFTEATKKSSDRFAEQNNLPKYQHILHPRTTGFTYLVDQMTKKKCLDAVYDVTLIYPDVVPQNEERLFSGHFPKQVKAHLVRYPVSSLPTTESGLKEFLEKRWLEKEKTIQEFKATGRFLHGKVLNKDGSPGELRMSFVFWFVLPQFVFLLFIYVTWFRNWSCIEYKKYYEENDASTGSRCF